MPPSSFPAALAPHLERIDPFSLALGILVCGVAALFLLLILLHRAERRQALLALQTEHLQEIVRQREDELQRLGHRQEQLDREGRRMESDNAALRTACQTMRQQLMEREALLAATTRQIEQQFQHLAAEAINERGEQLGRQHADSLTLLLRPLQEQLAAFKGKIEAIHDHDTRDRVSLLKEIEHLRQLNIRISTEANQLSEALRGGVKTQGIWGEMVLVRVLEASGLREGREYEVQPTHTNEAGATLRPDVVVHLPEERSVIIDAKVSLQAFVAAAAAPDEETRNKQIRLHLESVRRQIALLSGKKYHRLSGPGALDFVILFLPIEGAFQLAVEQDPELLTSALHKQVALAGPSTLLAILRTIHHLWRVDEQNRNSLVIAKQAGNLYDKFVGFTEAFEEIGLRINQTSQAWHTARNRLSTGQGNLIARTEALKQLGVQPTRALPDSLQSDTSRPGDST
ncbi:MAG: DNA recombination protein RmuC [Desulfobulbus sp.]